MAIRATTETKLLDAADALFFSAGISATPIDAVLERAGVSAATLYRGYPSKEALVGAALDRRHRAWLDVWDAAIQRAASPQDRLLAVFDALESFRLRVDGARWCAFLGSAAEYADPPDEIGRAVARDTAAFRDRLRGLAEPLVGSHAAALAEELLLIISGDFAMRLRDPNSDTTVARAIAVTILRAHERASTTDG